MADRAEALKAGPPKVARKGAAAKRTFTMRALWRLTMWATTAAGAVFIAALASRSDIGLERIALIRQGAQPHMRLASASRTFDAQAETRRLAEELRGLNANNEQIKSRLAAVERDMDDVTGSISRQTEAAKATARRADDGPSVAATAALTASIGVPAALAPAARTQYGVDIGSGLTIEALRTRWLTIRAAHPQLLEGLEPVVGVKDTPHANRIELRLIAGPFAQANAAAQLCAAFTAVGLFCQPTVFDGQHLAVR